MANMPPTLGRYLSAQLGTGSPSQLFARMLRQSFGASTFTSFWRHWNPIYGYFLAYYVFTPLSRVLSRPLSLVLTFMVSGFALHDLLLWPAFLITSGKLPFPIVTLAFAILGTVVLAAERYGLTLSSLTRTARASVHAGVILSAFAVSVGVAFVVAK